MKSGHVGIAGELRIILRDKEGSVKLDTGYNRNLILNQGLDFFGGGKGGALNQSCVIGSGNSAPEVTQTKLDAFIAMTSAVSTEQDNSYQDRGDNLYRIWEEKKYRFEGLNDVNISEIGLASQGSSSNYFLTTRTLVKDSLGNPTSISVRSGETLDIFYKIHKVIGTEDTSYVINLLDGSGGSTPYNVVVRAQDVGGSGNSVSTVGSAVQLVLSDKDNLLPVTSQGLNSTTATGEFEAYVEGSYKIVSIVNLGLNTYNKSIRTAKSRIISYAYKLISFQMRLGSVDGDLPIIKTNKDIMSIPLEFSWGRFEGEL